MDKLRLRFRVVLFSGREASILTVLCGIAIFGLFSDFSVAQFPKKIELQHLRNNWSSIEKDLENCSGTVSVTISLGLQSKPVPDQGFEFRMRGNLMKSIDPKKSPKSDEVENLWAKEGRYVLRKPIGGSWSIAQRGAAGSKWPNSPDVERLRAVSIFGIRLLDLTSNKDYQVIKIEQTSEVEVQLEIYYPKTMQAFDWKKFDTEDRMPPIFDRAKIILDPSNRHRIRSYSLMRALKDSRGRSDAELTYGENIPRDIPTNATLTFGTEDGKTINRKDLAQFTNMTAIAPPESEFTLEHYGLETPKQTSQISWWLAGLLTIMSLAFLYFGVRFFRRR